MTYPNNFENKTGFDKIRLLIKEECISPLGKEKVDEMSFSTDFEKVLNEVNQTAEFVRITQEEDEFPVNSYFDVRESLQKIRVEGTFLDERELFDLRRSLETIGLIVRFFQQKEEEQYFYLKQLAGDIFTFPDLIKQIDRILDKFGRIKDNASLELAEIRHAVTTTQSSISRNLQSIIRQAQADGYIEKDVNPTMRDGRLVIPVAPGFKRKIKGIVHDESATGKTVFIEPEIVVEANNKIRELEAKEKREVIRILTAFTNEVRPRVPELLVSYLFLAEVDFIRAKALFALKTNCLLPSVEKKMQIDWVRAIHPLLYLSHKKLGKEVVPLDISLDEDKRILLISGPNAGGKSVCLKTVGLLQYMLQCGMLIPLHESSRMGFFEKIFIDIGDEQSIENDLSTYSSHLKNLNVMLQHLNPSSLFLIDEFGSGTEPVLGGAMAESILEELYQNKSFGIITTHYGNLKLFCDTHPEAENGAMLFDTKQMKPLFKLQQGKPGSSFTYEIARQIGLPDAIIGNAISKSGTAQIDYEKKLEEIEIEKLEIEQMLKRVTQTDDKLAEMIANYSAKFSEFEKQRKDILQKAKNQALSIIDGANQAIEKTIREIKEAKADATKTKLLRTEVYHHKEKIEKEVQKIEDEKIIKPIVPLKQELEKPKFEPLDLKIRVGDAVFINDIQTIGEVTQLQGEDITVSFNSISFKTHIHNVTKISKKEARSVKRGSAKLDGTRIGDMLNEKVAKFSPKIDVRGKRAEEALQMLETYIDEAVLLGIHQVTILHGKGNGILRHVIRQFLAKRKEVTQFYDEAWERGGAGITIVEL